MVCSKSLKARAEQILNEAAARERESKRPRNRQPLSPEQARAAAELQALADRVLAKTQKPRKLHVAPPRGCNVQLSGEKSSKRATPGATTVQQPPRQPSKFGGVRATPYATIVQQGAGSRATSTPSKSAKSCTAAGPRQSPSAGLAAKVWRCVIDGRVVTVIDPERQSEAAMLATLQRKFGAERVGKLSPHG